MERLTYRSPIGNAVSKGACSGVKCDFDCDSCPIDTIVQHLCYYEDMIESGKLVEQKRGQWVMKETMIRSPFAKNAYCSVCLEEASYAHNYCPNCGAKMDGGNEDG
jgi:hypothetical protein